LSGARGGRLALVVGLGGGRLGGHVGGGCCGGGVAGLCFAKRLTKKAWDSDDFWAFVAVGCGLWVVVGFDCGDSGCDRCGG
jgi:hypothetical protein